MTFGEIVNDYIREYRNDARAEMRFFEIQHACGDPERRGCIRN